MKMFLVCLLLVTLSLNSFAEENLKGNQGLGFGVGKPGYFFNPYGSGLGANPYKIGYGSLGLPSNQTSPKVCEIQDEDSKGPYIRTFSYRPTKESSKMEYLSIVTTRPVLDKKKQPTGKISFSVIKPPNNDVKKIKFSGKANSDKAALLESNLKLCIAQDKSKSIQVVAQTQAALLSQVPSLVDQAAADGFKIGYMTGLSEEAYLALLLGKEIGKQEGLEQYVPVAYEMGFDDGHKVGEVKGIVMGFVGTIEIINEKLQRGGANSAKVYGERVSSEGGFWTSDGALTGRPADTVNPNENVVEKSSLNADGI